MTDIEGSTRLAGRLGDAFAQVLDEHFVLLDAAISAHEGTLVSSEGDLCLPVQFRAAGIAAAIDAQRALVAHSWPADDSEVRMGVHAGEALAAATTLV
jgi:class 3 adenylate cyclase